MVVEFRERIQARDWDGLGRLLSDDFVVNWPDTRVRIRGRENFVEFNRSYPEGWTILNVDGDRVVGGREYWLKEHEEELSSERANLFEPM